MNPALKPSSENTISSSEDDPPDSLILKNKIPKIKLEEPLGKEDKSSFSPTELPKEVKVRKRMKFSCDFAAARVKEGGSFFVAKNIEIISEIEHCRKLWKEFSSQKTLFDTWEFRFAFYRAYGYKPYFLILKENFKNIALLPLWYDETKKKYTWFGSNWQEEVRFFAKEPNYILALISAAPSSLYLNAIAKDSVEPIKNKIKFEYDDPKYVLNLEGLKNHEDYLMTLKKNRRRNLRKDRNRILKQNPEIIINKFSDFNYLVQLSKKRFGERGMKTDWEDPRRIKAFEEVIKLGGKSYQTRMITVKINKEIAGVDLICLLNNTYFTVKCGYAVKKFPGIGNFINLVEIDDAIKLGMKKIDFLQNNYGWKNQYFQSQPLFKFKK